MKKEEKVNLLAFFRLLYKIKKRLNVQTLTTIKIKEELLQEKSNDR